MRRAPAPLRPACAAMVAAHLALGSSLMAAQNPPVAAGDTTAGKRQQAVSDAVPFAIPETPAFIYLGVTPAKVARPTSGRSLGASLVDGIDESGRVKQGLAFEVAPFAYVASTTLTRYQEDPGAFILSNLKLSLGTARTSGDSASTDMALGVRIVAFDRGDPLLDDSLTELIGREMGKCAPSGDEPPPPELDIEEVTLQCLRAKTDRLARDWAKDHWNASSLAFAAATGLRFTESRLTHSRGTGFRGWGVYGQQLGSWGQGIISGAYTYHRVSGEDSTYHAGSLGIRLLVGHERINGFLEAVGERRFDAGRLIDKNVGTWAGGIEFLATSDIWISTGFGSVYGDEEAPDRVVVFANIRWGISRKSRLSPT